MSIASAPCQVAWTRQLFCAPMAIPANLIRPALAGVAPYVPGRPVADVQRELGISDVVKLASNESPFPPMPAALDVIRAGAADLKRYPEADWALREALGEHLGIPADQVLAGNGVDSLIRLFCHACLDVGDRLVMGWPSFISWRQSTLVQGAEPVLVPLAADGAYDLDALLAAVDERTKLVVVVSPNNPTGGEVSAVALERFLRQVPDHVLPILDEAYFEFLGPDAHDGVALAARLDRPVAVMRTFSKAYSLAGLRVGYVVGPPELIVGLSRVRNIFDVNALAQAAAIASLADAPAHLPERIQVLTSERESMSRGLAALGLAPCRSAGNFVFVEVGPERAAALNSALLSRGIIIRPTGPFGAPGGIRASIGWPDENRRFLDALGELLPTLPV